MPELAEVAWYSRQWDAGMDRRVTRVHVNAAARVFKNDAASAIAAALRGRRCERVHLHGKQMLHQFSDGGWLGVHLGMTGELAAAAPDHEPGRHDHLVIFTDAPAALVFRDPRKFGRLTWDEGREPPAWWRALPPHVLDRAFTADRLAAVLTKRRMVPLKALLLDQSVFPGIGNWMADEILWRLRLAPATPAGKADALALHREVRFVSRQAMRTIGRDWSDPPAAWLFRHRWRDGGTCPRCGTPLVRESLRGRTACHCPACQAA